MKNVIKFFAMAVLAIVVAGCDSDADVVSRNLSTAADQFEIDRRIVFYNGITGEYMLVIEGRCSLGNRDSAQQRSVTCKTGNNEYKRHFLGLSDNVTYFAEQTTGSDADPYRYRVIFKPESIIPNFDLETSITN